jgi:hypothetical protein
MNAFRDPTASLLDRIHHLEKENERPRRREHRRRREVIRNFTRTVLQCIGLMICVAIAIFGVTFFAGLMIVIAHA